MNTSTTQPYGTAEVAGFFRVDPRTARRWATAGLVKAERVSRRYIRISLDGVEIPEGPLLKTCEVADLFNVPRKTATRWAAEGVLPAVRMPSGRWRFFDGPARKRLAEGGPR